MNLKQSMALAWSMLFLGVAFGGCTVDFDPAQPNTFRCKSDSDCLAPSTCIKAMEAADGDDGVCGSNRGGGNDPQCVDNDGDGYGEGPACMGPDCDDDDKDVYPGALEVCDGVDNDCDCPADARDTCELSNIDEAQECTADADCDTLANADSEASQGMRCVQGACVYRCPLDNVGVCGTSGPDGGGAVESCQTTRGEDGVVTANVPGCGVSGAYGDDYLLTDEDSEACDGLDNNCNGQVDGSRFCNVCDMPCPEQGDVGECTSGIRICEDNMPIGCFLEDTMEPATVPVDEVCDNKDNDCDGIVDNARNSTVAGSVCDDGCPFGMRLIRQGNESFCMDRFEASKPDATVTGQGEDTRFSTSRAGVLPWTGLSLAQARDACQAAGRIDGLDYPSKRLCRLREITYACGGVNMEAYSYGLTYNGNICNGADAGIGASVPTGPSNEVPQSFSSCTAERGDVILYDLIGNVAEFVLDGTQGKVYGGSYSTNAAGLTCQSALDGQDAADNIGFRCCYDPE